MQSKKNLLSELITRDLQAGFFKSFGILPNPDKILKRTGKTIEAYRDLKNDPHVWSCIQSRKSGLLSLEYMLLPGSASEHITNEIRNIIADIDINQIERDILEAPLFGWQPLEIIWKIVGGAVKFLVPDRIAPKPQEWFFFDNEGELKYRREGDLQGITPPPMKIVAVQYESTYMNPYGHPLLGKCYWPVTFKNGGLRFWVNFMERYGMPVLLGKYTRGASFEEAQKLADELANMTEDAVIVAPEDIELTMQEAVRSTSVDLYKELIKHCNAEISKAILSQTLTTELDMGSYAASMTHYKIRREVIQSDIRLVERTINRIIRYIVDLNFSGGEYPEFKVLINDAENMEKVERDQKIAQTGNIQFTKKYWMNSYGFKEEEINIK